MRKFINLSLLLFGLLLINNMAWSQLSDGILIDSGIDIDKVRADVQAKLEYYNYPERDSSLYEEWGILDNSTYLEYLLEIGYTDDLIMTYYHVDPINVTSATITTPMAIGLICDIRAPHILRLSFALDGFKKYGMSNEYVAVFAEDINGNRTQLPLLPIQHLSGFMYEIPQKWHERLIDYMVENDTEIFYIYYQFDNGHIIEIPIKIRELYTEGHTPFICRSFLSVIYN